MKRSLNGIENKKLIGFGKQIIHTYPNFGVGVILSNVVLALHCILYTVQFIFDETQKKCKSSFVEGALRRGRNRYGKAVQTN